MASAAHTLDTSSQGDHVAPPGDLQIDRRHFLESLVCDLHWTCLHVGTINYLVQAASTRGLDLRLGAWRHLLHDNTSISQLALRYCPDLGILPETQRALSQLYADLSDALKVTHQLLKAHGIHADIARRSLQPLLSAWSQVNQKGEHALKVLDPVTRQKLSVEYADNARIILAFLHEGPACNGSRLNEWGEITLPTLAQRRLHPRAVANQACTLHIDGVAHQATIQDASLSGLGVLCPVELPIGATLVVEIDGGRRLQATVVRAQGSLTGLRLAIPLSKSDPLFQRRSLV